MIQSVVHTYLQTTFTELHVTFVKKNKTVKALECKNLQSFVEHGTFPFRATTHCIKSSPDEAVNSMHIFAGECVI